MEFKFFLLSIIPNGKNNKVAKIDNKNILSIKNEVISYNTCV